MSLASKIALITATGFSIGTIFYVHYKQGLDRDRMHEGVIRDVERQQRRKVENLYNLQKQIDLTKDLKKQYDSDSVT